MGLKDLANEVLAGFDPKLSKGVPGKTLFIKH